MEPIDKSIKKLEIVIQWISNVDTKSSFVLAFYGIMTTIMFASDIGNRIINTLSYIPAQDINGESIKLFIALAIVILLLISILITFYFIFQTLKGRLNPNVYQQHGLRTDSNLFFGTVASKSYSKFEEQTNAENDNDFLNDVNSQVFINSNIVNRKFKLYNRSLIWLIISFLLFLIFMIIQ